jgi:hypothetical protein
MEVGDAMLFYKLIDQIIYSTLKQNYFLLYYIPKKNYIEHGKMITS